MTIKDLHPNKGGHISFYPETPKTKEGFIITDFCEDLVYFKDPKQNRVWSESFGKLSNENKARILRAVAWYLENLPEEKVISRSPSVMVELKVLESLEDILLVDFKNTKSKEEFERVIGIKFDKGLAIQGITGKKLKPGMSWFVNVEDLSSKTIVPEVEHTDKADYRFC